eukprot:SAG31_NODE_821_length_11784_cov_62.658194_5_plen_289_part_00
MHYRGGNPVLSHTRYARHVCRGPDMTALVRDELDQPQVHCRGAQTGAPRETAFQTTPLRSPALAALPTSTSGVSIYRGTSSEGVFCWETISSSLIHCATTERAEVRARPQWCETAGAVRGNLRRASSLSWIAQLLSTPRCPRTLALRFYAPRGTRSCAHPPRSAAALPTTTRAAQPEQSGPGGGDRLEPLPVDGGGVHRCIREGLGNQPPFPPRSPSRLRAPVRRAAPGRSASVWRIEGLEGHRGPREGGHARGWPPSAGSPPRWQRTMWYAAAASGRLQLKCTSKEL